jgi:hypothetical protein
LHTTQENSAETAANLSIEPHFVHKMRLTFLFQVKNMRNLRFFRKPSAQISFYPPKSGPNFTLFSQFNPVYPL